MALLVRTGDIPATPVSSGARETRLLDEQSHLSAVSVELASGARHELAAREGADTYLYVFSGEVEAQAGSGRWSLPAGSFATFPEGTALALSGTAESSTVHVVTAKGGQLAGVPSEVSVVSVGDLPKVDVPEQKKQRTYLVGKEAVPSERSHAMIVGYTGETLTKSHHHPNAECIFLFLEGNALLLNEGTEEPVRPGDFAFFGVNKSHGMRSADGDGLSFLEFHAPAEFVTVRE